MNTSSYDSPLRGGCFSYDAALSRPSIHSAEIQLIPHVDTSANTDAVKGGTRPVERVQKWTRGLTRSPCHQVELKCCGSQAQATLNGRAARTRETHSPQPRSTPDIINYHFINFASGHRESHAVAQMMCWNWKWAASQRWLSIGSIWGGLGGLGRKEMKWSYPRLLQWRISPSALRSECRCQSYFKRCLWCSSWASTHCWQVSP